MAVVRQLSLEGAFSTGKSYAIQLNQGASLTVGTEGDEDNTRSPEIGKISINSAADNAVTLNLYSGTVQGVSFSSTSGYKFLPSSAVLDCLFEEDINDYLPVGMQAVETEGGYRVTSFTPETGHAPDSERRRYGQGKLCVPEPGAPKPDSRALRKFLADYTGVTDLEITKNNVTVDLNGRTYNYTGTATATPAVRINGDNISVTIKNGAINSRVQGVYVGIGIAEASRAQENTALILDDVDLTASGTFGVLAYGLSENTIITIQNGSTISVTSSDSADNGGIGVYFPPISGTLSIQDSEVTAGTGVAVKGGTVNISNSTIKGTGEAQTGTGPASGGVNTTGDAVYVEGGYDRPIDLNIISGDYSSSHGKAVQKLYADTEDSQNIAITGGRFSSDVSDYVAKDSVAIPTIVDGETVYTIGTATPVAQIEGKEGTYSTLAAAVAAVPENTPTTIKLLRGYIASTDDIVTIPAGKEITLDMNGQAITVTSDFVSRPFTNRGTFTLTGNGTVDVRNSPNGGYGTVNNFGTLTVEDGTYIGIVSSNASNFYNRNGGMATFVNPTIYGGAGCIATEANTTTEIRGGYYEDETYPAIENRGDMTITGGTFYNTSCSSCSGNWGYTIRSGQNAANANLKIQGATDSSVKVTGVQGALAVIGGKADIYNGHYETIPCPRNSAHTSSFYAGYFTGESYATAVTVHGGTFKALSRTAVLIGNSNPPSDSGAGKESTVEILGGTFIGGDADKTAITVENTDHAKGAASITGGQFSSDVKDYIANEHDQLVTETGDTPYIVGHYATDGAAASAMNSNVYKVTYTIDGKKVDVYYLTQAAAKEDAEKEGVPEPVITPVDKPSGTGSSDDSRANANFWEDVEEEIRDAASGEIVKVDARSFDRLPLAVMEALRRTAASPWWWSGTAERPSPSPPGRPWPPRPGGSITPSPTWRKPMTAAPW